MIELYSANTPNGKKISIMLEEIGYEYKVININLNKGEQFKPEFKIVSFPCPIILATINVINNTAIEGEKSLIKFVAFGNKIFKKIPRKIGINTTLIVLKKSPQASTFK